MNRKITRFTLLIPMVAVLIFIGAAVTFSVTTSTFQSTNDTNDGETNTEFPAEYGIYEILGVEGCTCIAAPGKVFEDVTPPDIILSSPPNNSLILTNSTIFIEATDNFPAFEPAGAVPFVPEYLYYHWNDAVTNTTGYDAARDGAPPNDVPVELELTLPNDEANVTHKLYIYAVDYYDNWNSSVFIFFTPSDSGETSVPITTITTTIEPTSTSTSITTIETTTNSTTISTSEEVTTEYTNATTTESTTTHLSTIQITSGFSTYAIVLILMMLLLVKKGRRKKDPKS